ncbi:MAG TPA: hypothetical protein PKG80_07985 [Acidobacteriota bacterium]|nr:hypothetical protein [Acidobacteriota bacterium]
MPTYTAIATGADVTTGTVMTTAGRGGWRVTIVGSARNTLPRLPPDVDLGDACR